MNYLGKGEMLTNRNVNKCVHQICQKIHFFCARNISGIFYFSSWNMGPTLYMLCLYFCSVQGMVHIHAALHSIVWDRLQFAFFFCPKSQITLRTSKWVNQLDEVPVGCKYSGYCSLYNHKSFPWLLWRCCMIMLHRRSNQSVITLNSFDSQLTCWLASLLYCSIAATVVVVVEEN
jgi:hypothetical protein